MSCCDNRVVVVTGASSGIGQAIALAFASSDTRLILHGNQNLNGLAATAKHVQARDAESYCIVSDFACRDSVRKFVSAAFQRYGRVDVWIQAAGADVLTGPAGHANFETKLRRLLEVDVAAGLLICREAAQRMSEQPEYRMEQSTRPSNTTPACPSESPTCPDETSAACDVDKSKAGELSHSSGSLSQTREPIERLNEPLTILPSLITIGWSQATEGMAGDSGQMFGATKAAVAAFTKSLAKTFGPKLRANCLAPGWIKTAWGQTAPAEWDQRARGESCMDRWGTPEDIAQAAVWLSSSAASFINGQTLNVDGGWKPAYGRKI